VSTGKQTGAEEPHVTRIKQKNRVHINANVHRRAAGMESGLRTGVHELDVGVAPCQVNVVSADRREITEGAYKSAPANHHCP
jgi:hypothetical protein